MNFGYERETTLLTRITPPATLAAGAPVDLNADVTWLVCEKECIPGEARLSLTLPVAGPGASPGLDPRTRALFDAARAALPQPAPWPARMDVGPEWLTLNVARQGPEAEAIRSAFFFPYAETLIRHAAPQQLQVTATASPCASQRSALSTAPPTDAGGVLVIETALGATHRPQQAFELANVGIVRPGRRARRRLPRRHPAGRRARPARRRDPQSDALRVPGAVDQGARPDRACRRQSRRRRAPPRPRLYRRRAGGFAALGGALLGLRAAGAEVGWGFQLQSPVTVAVLAYVLFAMGLSLSGVFHLGGSLQGVGRAPDAARRARRLVLRPACSRPWWRRPARRRSWATAVGFALTQPAAIALAVILALGLGLALPFLLLTLAPQLIDRLPRPAPGWRR